MLWIYGRDPATAYTVEENPGRSLVSTLGLHMRAPKHMNIHVHRHVYTHTCKQSKTEPQFMQSSVQMLSDVTVVLKGNPGPLMAATVPWSLSWDSLCGS